MSQAVRAGRTASSRPTHSRRLMHFFSRNAIIELTVFLALAVAYNVVRASPSTNAALAMGHARDILSLEGPIFRHLEVPLNTWMVGQTAIAVAACYFYAVMHYFATPIIFFLSRHRGGWQYWRGYWALVLASGLALVGYALYPAAPPRLMPGLGIVDVMRHFSDYGWWGAAASAPRGIGDATNQFAAMPSMHFGWALWCSIQMWGIKSKVWRGLAVAYPSVLLVVVLGTGNHFLLDVVAGAACVLLAYAVVQLIGKPRGASKDAAASSRGSTTGESHESQLSGDDSEPAGVSASSDDEAVADGEVPPSGRRHPAVMVRGR